MPLDLPSELGADAPAALVLARAERERDAAYAARDAAEDARTRAELARNAAEAAGEAARVEAAVLGEQLLFLHEQVRSTRAYHAGVAEAEVAVLLDDRASLLRELALLRGALRDRG